MTKARSSTATKIAVHDAAQYIVEPKDLWTSRLSAQHAELAPKVVARDDGTDAWVFDNGRSVDPVGLEVAASRTAGPLRRGYAYADLDPGLTDGAARLRTMDTEGIEQASIFPTY